MSAAQARVGSRHGGGPGAARVRAVRLHHSAADCCVQIRTHAAQARLQTHVQAIKHLLTTKLRPCQNASHRTSLTAAADMKLRYAVMMYTRANTLARQELAGIGLAAEPGGWPAGGEGLSRQDKVVQIVLSEHADLGALHGSRGQPRQPAISRPHGTSYNSKDERQARTGHNTSRESRLPRLQDSQGAEAPGQPGR